MTKNVPANGSGYRPNDRKRIVPPYVHETDPERRTELLNQTAEIAELRRLLDASVSTLSLFVGIYNDDVADFGPNTRRAVKQAKRLFKQAMAFTGGGSDQSART